MGYSTWSTREWATYSTSTASKPTAAIFTKRDIDSSLDPKGVLVRESRDSDFNPNSTPIIVGCDVTGSMGMIADHLVRKGIGVFFEEILARKPVSDPHMMVMGIGDAKYDKAPLQVSQFEADITIAQWLEKIYVEHGGGGNCYESYDLPYYFAAKHTSIDSWEKRGKKGYIFTIGDEEAPFVTFADQVRNVIGDEIQQDIPFSDVLAEAMKMYNCYHIIIAEGSHARFHSGDVKDSWMRVMGQRALWLEDHTKLSELMVSTIQINEGENKNDVIKSWSGNTEMVISRALDGIDNGGKMVAAVVPGRGIRRFK